MNERIELKNIYAKGLLGYINVLKEKYKIQSDDMTIIITYLLAIDNEILYAKLEATL